MYLQTIPTVTTVVSDTKAKNLHACKNCSTNYDNIIMKFSGAQIPLANLTCMHGWAKFVMHCNLHVHAVLSPTEKVLLFIVHS